jgi:hypothetical protein
VLTTPTIKIFYEVGKHVALKARGVAALIVATGLGAAAVAAAQNLAETSRKAQNWITGRFTDLP